MVRGVPSYALALSLVVACAHQSPDPAPSNRAEEGCGDTVPAACCQLQARADLKVRQNDRPAAVQLLHEARQRCPLVMDIRRRLFLAEHGETVQAGGAPKKVRLEARLRHTLPEQVHMALFEVFVNGERLQPGTLSLRAGTHVITEEVLLTIDAPPQRIWLHRQQEIQIPESAPEELIGGLTVAIREDPGRPASERFSMNVDFRAPAPPPAQPSPAEPVSVTKLPATVAKGFVIHAPFPAVSPALARHMKGQEHHVLLKVCSDESGDVSAVTLLKRSANPVVDAASVEAMGRRKYRPYEVNGRRVPMCHPVNVTHRM